MTDNYTLITRRDIETLHGEFLLFGDPASPYWMLGLEEAEFPNIDPEAEIQNKKQSVDEFIQTLILKTKKFKQAGKMSLRDFGSPEGSGFLPPIDYTKERDASDTKYQTTWGGYIKLILSINGNPNNLPWSIQDVKLYQKYHLGMLSSHLDPLGTCLLELFPLGRKNRSEWPYKFITDRDGLDYLESPSKYQREVVGNRVQLLMKLVEKHRPKFLMCFGADCRNSIRRVLSGNVDTLKIDNGNKMVVVSMLQHEKTSIVFSAHPASRITSDLYWRNLGEQLAGKSNDI